MKALYMHTLDGKPATFDGTMIHYVGGRSRARLCSSREQLIREQQASRRYLADHGWDSAADGYVLVELPAVPR